MRKISVLAAAAVVVTALAVNAPLRAQPYGPGMMGGGYGQGYGMMGGGYGPGMMQGYGPGMMGGCGGGYGPGMMGPGYGGGYGQGQVQGQGYGPGMMGGQGYGPGMMGGYGQGQGQGQGQGYGPGMMGGTGAGNDPNQGNLNISVDDVKNYLERTISNPNLKVGDVKEKDADTIIAEVVTKDKGGLVQRFLVNRHNGSYQPEAAQ